MIPHPHQALATLNAVGLAFAVWRDRRELNFVEAIVAGRRAGKQRRADARRWKTRKKKVPSGANRVARPSSGGASVQNEQVDEGPAAPNGAAALAPVTKATLKTCQSRIRSAVAPRCGGDGKLAVSPRVLAKRAARVDDDDDDISPRSGGDGEIMAAPVRRGRGNKSGSLAPDLDDSMGAKYAENEARLRLAQAKLQEAEERLKQSELELLLCEADERSLGVLLSESTERSCKGPQATGPAAEALRAERLLRARQHLGTEQTRRQMASMVAKARLETATARLAEADVCHLPR